YYTGTYTLANLPASGGSSTAPSTVGSYTVLASFPGSADYSSGQALANFTINQASPTVTWANPAPVPYGTAPRAAHLDAPADVPGTFSYAPDAGTVLGAGAHTLSVTFTPADTADYSSATASVALAVSPAPLKAAGIGLAAAVGVPFSGAVA